MIILGQEIKLPRADDTPAIFHYLAARLLEQNAPSHDPVKAQFRIRDAEHRADPIGFLLPDELYHPDLESFYTVTRVAKESPGMQWADSQGYNLHLLVWLTTMHDLAPAVQWAESLKLLAVRFHTTLELPDVGHHRQ